MASMTVPAGQYRVSLPNLTGFVCEPEILPVGQRAQTEKIQVYPDQNRWLVPLQLKIQPFGQFPAAQVAGATVSLSDNGGVRPTDFTSTGDGSVYGTWPAGELHVKPEKLAYVTPVQADFMMRSGQPQEWIPVYYKAIPARISIRPELKPFGLENAITGVTFELRLPGQEVPLRQTTQGSQAIVFSDLAPGPAKVRVIPPTEYGGSPIVLIGAKNEVEVNLNAGDDQDLSPHFRFRYETGSLRGRVVDSAGRALSGVAVVAQSNGLAKTAQSNSQGKYVFRKLRVGAWTVMLDQAAVVVGGRTLTASTTESSISAQVNAKKTARADDFMLELDEHGVRGQVTDDSGKPVPYAVIEIRDQQMNVIDTVVADAQGNYSWKSPSSGMFVVSLLQQDGQTVQRQVVTVNSWCVQNLTSPSSSAPATAPRLGSAPTHDDPATGTSPSDRIPHDAITDLSAYPVLTEEITTTGVPAPSGGGFGAGAPGAGYAQAVDQVMRDVLGWRPSGDLAGFRAALTGAFQLREVEGHTQWSWQQRGYAVQADMGALTGAQASIYARAKSALDQILPLLAGLITLNPALYQPQDLEAIRTVVNAELNELVTELALPGGPRIQRVDQLFLLLLGESRRSSSLDPDLVGGNLGTLRDRFGLTVDNVDTVDEERIVTNFRVIVEQILALKASWDQDRKLLSGVNARTALGTVLIWLSRGLEAVCESVDDLAFALDSVYVDAAQRQVIELRFANQTVNVPDLPLTRNSTTPYKFGSHEPPLLLSDLLDWITRASRDEGPRIVQDAGKDGVLAFEPVLDRLRILLHATRQIARHGTALPSGMRTPRVNRALQVLAAQLDEATNLAHLVKREPIPQIAEVTSVTSGGTGTIVVSVLGSNLHRSDSAVLIADGREDLPELRATALLPPSTAITGTSTTPAAGTATATFTDPSALRNTAGTTWLVALIDRNGTSSNQVEAMRVPYPSA
jgi:Carboxypeptidase regulatory-like domain